MTLARDTDCPILVVEDDDTTREAEWKPGVLVVDDEAQVRQLLQRVLAREGFPVWSAPSGPAAAEFYRRNQGLIGAVPLDVKMPGLDGPATLAALRQLNPHVRALIVRGDAGEYTPEALLGMGADAVLQKSFDLAELSLALGRALACGQPEQPGPVCLNLHATADLPLVLDPVVEAMGRLGYPGKDIFGVRLSLEEALVNALEHDNRGDPGQAGAGPLPGEGRGGVGRGGGRGAGLRPRWRGRPDQPARAGTARRARPAADAPPPEQRLLQRARQRRHPQQAAESGGRGREGLNRVPIENRRNPAIFTGVGHRALRLSSGTRFSGPRCGGRGGR